MMGEADWRSALHHKESKLDPRRHSIQVGASQRIPLNGRPTSSNQHYYPSNQPFYPTANPQDTANGMAATKPEHRYGPFSALIGSPRKKASLPVRTISTDQHQGRRKEQHVSSGSSSLMSKGASSSNSSSSSSTGYKSHYRFTLPSITTTSKFLKTINQEIETPDFSVKKANNPERLFTGGNLSEVWERCSVECLVGLECEGLARIVDSGEEKP